VAVVVMVEVAELNNNLDCIDSCLQFVIDVGEDNGEVP